MTSSSPGAFPRVQTFFLTLVVLLRQHAGCAGDGFQRFLVSPENLVAREGDDVVLPCAIVNQRGKVQWTKDGFALGFHRDVPGYPRYSYIGDASRGQHHLAISSVTFSDAGEYQCQVGPTLSNPPIWAAANLTVVLPPSGINLVGQSDGSMVEVVAGASLTLRCLVPDARPPPKLLWYLDEKQLPADQVDSQVVRSVVPHRWSVRSKLTLQPRMQDDGGRVICRVLHPGLEGGGALATSVTLSVLHPPGPPTVSGLVEGDTLRAGERRNLTCTCLGGNPYPSLIWYRAGRLLDDSYTPMVQERGVRTVNTLELLATEADDGVMLECQAASDLMHLPLTANLTLSVYYGPAAVRVSGPARAEEGQIVALRCETSPSNPSASITWQVNGEEVDSPNVVVKRVPSGGWVTSSRLEWKVEGPWQGKTPRQLAVECEANHQSLRHGPHHTLLITLVKSAGAPVLGGEVLEPVVAGSSVEVTCASPYSLPQTSIRIYHEGRIVPSRLEHTTAVTQARGRVKVNPPDNGSELKCEVISPASTKPKVISTKLSVLFPPRDLMGSLEPEVVEEGSHVTLTCLTSSSNPPANLTWTSQGSLPPMATTTTSPASVGGTSTRSEVVMVVQAEDHKRHIICEANNGLGSSLQKRFVLNVLYAPAWREKPPKQVDVWEGSDVSITASASANPGPVRYWWRRGEESLVGAGGTLHLGSATKRMAGNYSISAYSQRGAINTTFFLNVKYGPDSVMAPDQVTVGEGDAVDIRCSASGNPLPSLTWMARNQSVGSGVGVARLVLRSAQREDTGLYTCQASSSLPSPPQPVPTKLIVTQPVSVAEEDNEVKGSWASLGGKGQLVCQVRAAPAPTFLWTTKKGMKIHNGDKYIIHKPVVVDGLVTWSSVLEISDVSPQDYQPYHCSATNPLGSGSTTLTLRPPSRPFPPTNFTVISVSNVSVVLGWSPNLAGTRPLGYTVRYHPTGTHTFQYEEVPDGSSTGVEVGGLTPEMEYSLTAQAKNNQGRSDYVTPPVIVTTLVAGEEGVEGKESHHVTSFLLLVIIMSVFGLLVLNVAAIACFLRHRSKKSSLRGVHSSKTTSSTAVGNTTSNPDHHHHHNHNQVFLALDSLSRKKNKKSKDQTKQNSGKRASVIPLPSPSFQRNKTFHIGRFNKRTAVADKSRKPFIHNGKIPKPPPILQHNNKSSSHTVKDLSPESSKPQRHKKQVTRSSGVPEAHSLLIEHNQEKIISPTLRHQKDQDHLSQSSHESTQTAIFCEEIIPVSSINTAQEKHIQIPENQSVYQLNKEVKQYFKNREMTHQLQSDEGSSKSLEYINLDHCPGAVTDSKSVSGQHQEHNCDHINPVSRNMETLQLDDTSTSSESHPVMDTRLLSHMPQEIPASYYQQEEIQILPAMPPKNTAKHFSPPSASLPNHWHPPPSPSYIQQHSIHSASSTKVRMGHQPPEPPAKARQHRAVSYSPSILGQRDGASESPPSVRHHRTPSESPVRAIQIPAPELPVSIDHHIDPSQLPVKSSHLMSPESPVRSSHHMRPSESPVRSSHHIRSESPVRSSNHMVSSESPKRYSHHMSPLESPEVIRRQYRTPSESTVKSVHHMSLFESAVRSKTRKNSESPQRAADHKGTLKSSPTRETSDSVPSRSLSRSRQQLAESSTKDVQHRSLSRSRQQLAESSTKDVQHQRHSESPVRYRALPESPVGGHRYNLPPTPQTRSHQQNQLPSTMRKMQPVHTLPESPFGHQQQHPQSAVQGQISCPSPGTSPASHNSPQSHQNPKPKPASPKSSEADILSLGLNTGTHSASFSPGQLNALHHPLTPSNSGRRNLPPTPPRSKKPRPLPSFPPSQPTLIQPSRLQSNPATRQLSPEEISTSFVLPESPRVENKQRILTHQLPSASATPSKSVSAVIDQESRIKFREMIKASPSSPSTVHQSGVRHGVIQTERSEGGHSSQSIRTMVTHFASANSPVATSSPITHRRRTRFPDDFLWQSTSGKL